MKLRGRDWVFLALIVVVALVTMRLGFWQISRHTERQDKNAATLARLDLPPIDLAELNYLENEVEFRRVFIEGVFVSEHEILLKNRARLGVPGFHLITPLRTGADEQAVLVDRGWIPQDDGELPERGRYQQDEPVLIEGIARYSQDEPAWQFLADPIPEEGDPPLTAWRLLNIEGIQGQMPLDLIPFYIMQTNTLDGEHPHPEPELDLSEGSHIGYAIQWFSFAAIAIIGGGYWLSRKRINTQG